MNNRMKIRLTLADGDSPLLGRGPNKHKPGCSAGQAHHVKKASHGMRTVRVLIAISRVTDRLINFHALPVGVQFVGQDHRQSCANYGSHFRAMSDNPDSSVRLDTYKYIGMQCGIIGVSANATGVVSSQYLGYIICTQDKRSRSSQALEKPTSTHIFNRAHAGSCAAALMAARMR